MLIQSNQTLQANASVKDLLDHCERLVDGGDVAAGVPKSVGVEAEQRPRGMLTTYFGSGSGKDKYAGRDFEARRPPPRLNPIGADGGGNAASSDDARRSREGALPVPCRLGCTLNCLAQSAPVKHGRLMTKATTAEAR